MVFFFFVQIKSEIPKYTRWTRLKKLIQIWSEIVEHFRTVEIQLNPRTVNWTSRKCQKTINILKKRQNILKICLENDNDIRVRWKCLVSTIISHRITKQIKKIVSGRFFYRFYFDWLRKSGSFFFFLGKSGIQKYTRRSCFQIFNQFAMSPGHDYEIFSHPPSNWPN